MVIVLYYYIGCFFNLNSGALASDGVIYCLSFNVNRALLAIDPLGEFVKTMKANMEDLLEEFRSLFQIPEVAEDSALSQTNFGHASCCGCQVWTELFLKDWKKV